MRYMLLAVGLSLVGCASSGEIRADGYAHAQRAHELEREGDYVAASRERASADKEFRKADERAYYEREGAYF
jgi:hypothetical protein